MAKVKNELKEKELTNRPMLSIITTFYNAEAFILNAVNSVNVQDKTGITYEYVLIDDKSKDNSRVYLKKYIKDNVKDPENWKIYEPDQNLGCGGARKFGIERAIGEHVMFLDADDYYMHTDFFKRALNDIQSNDADIVEYGILFNQGNGQQVNSVVPRIITIENPNAAEVAMFKDNLIKFNVWSKIYKRSIIDSYPYSDSRIFEDVRTTPFWIKNAKKIVIMPSIEINYRAAGESIIRKDPLDTRLGTITAIAELFDDPFLSSDMQIMKAMYGRAMVDLCAVLENHSSNDPGFNQMSRLNTKMLSKIYPEHYKQLTFHIEDEQTVNNVGLDESKLPELPELPELPDID